jgi:hypothetical protein
MGFEFDRDVGQYIPFDLLGSGARQQKAEQNQRIDEMMGRLSSGAPSVDDLAVNYQQLGTGDEYGNLLGDGSEVWRNGAGMGDMQAALRQLQQIAGNGGYTPADRAAQRAFEANTAQQLGANNQASLNSAYARGMGGGGAELAARLSGAQGAATAGAMNDAAIQQTAMQRAMQALQMQGALGSQLNNDQLARQQALDAYNQQQLNWRRGRAATNTSLGNQSRESRANAKQQVYSNAERKEALGAGQYQAAAQQQQQSQSSARDALGNFIGGLAGGVADLVRAGRNPSNGGGSGG